MAQQDEEGAGHYSLLGELHRIVYVAQARTSDSAHTEYLLFPLQSHHQIRRRLCIKILRWHSWISIHSIGYAWISGFLGSQGEIPLVYALPGRRSQDTT